MKTKNFANAHAAALKNELKSKIFDNRFAVFRLIPSIAILAVFASLAHGKSLDFTVLLGILFLLYCFLSSFVHKKYQLKQKFWTSLVKSYHLSQARVARNFAILNEHVAPWHHKIAQLPQSHMYACDIDLHKELFLFMDTCSTQGGSQKLFQLLLSAGVSPCAESEVKRRVHIAKKISQQKTLLRRFEALRLSEEFLKSYFKTQEQVEDAQTQQEKIKLWGNMRELAYAFMSLTAWFFLFIPQFLQYLQTKNTDLFLQPLFIYAIFILFGVMIYQPIVNKALEVSRNTKYIAMLLKSLPAKEKSGLEYEFLKIHSIKKISRMNFFVDVLSSRGNPVFWILIHIFFPFDALFCILLHMKLKTIIRELPLWRQEIYEFDFIVSLARLQYENPEFCFFLSSAQNSTHNIEISNMGHPLLPMLKRVNNSFSSTKQTPLILLTCSNMSGKSTFLRAFATNILLANIGAPVCASSFSLPRMRLLCAIRIDDSLSDGTSYFYAEVKRLAEILQQLNTSSIPCMFFVDEIFKGTNNRERYLGSLSILKAFLESGAFGFVSTHDLALTEMVTQEPKLRNMHFREHIEQDKLSFDYTLEDGPCPTSNALFIMKLAGLPIL